MRKKNFEIGMSYSDKKWMIHLTEYRKVWSVKPNMSKMIFKKNINTGVYDPRERDMLFEKIIIKIHRLFTSLIQFCEIAWRPYSNKKQTQRCKHSYIFSRILSHLNGTICTCVHFFFKFPSTVTEILKWCVGKGTTIVCFEFKPIPYAGRTTK